MYIMKENRIVTYYNSAKYPTFKISPLFISYDKVITLKHFKRIEYLENWNFMSVTCYCKQRFSFSSKAKRLLILG